MIDSRPWGYEGVDSTTIWAVEVVILVLRLVVAQWGEITQNSVDQIPPSIDWLVVYSEKYEFVNWDDDIPNWMEKYNWCSKPPTRLKMGFEKCALSYLVY